MKTVIAILMYLNAKELSVGDSITISPNFRVNIQPFSINSFIYNA